MKQWCPRSPVALLSELEGNIPEKASYSTFHPFQDVEGNKYGLFEVYYVGKGGKQEPGWYWHGSYKEGNPPDMGPYGPFLSREDAYHDAQGGEGG